MNWCLSGGLRGEERDRVGSELEALTWLLPLGVLVTWGLGE